MLTVCVLGACGYLGIVLLTALIHSVLAWRRRRLGQKLARLNIEVVGLRQKAAHYERFMEEMMAGPQPPLATRRLSPNRLRVSHGSSSP